MEEGPGTGTRTEAGTSRPTTTTPGSVLLLPSSGEDPLSGYSRLGNRWKHTFLGTGVVIFTYLTTLPSQNL